LTTSPAMLELRHFTNSTVKSRIKNIVKGGKPGSMEKGVGVSRNPFKTSTGFGLDSDRSNPRRKPRGRGK